MMPWVTQQQLQYTTGGRYQLPVLVLGDMTQKAEGKLETLLNKFRSVRAAEKIIFWKEVSQNCCMSCTFKLSLLHTADSAFSVLTVIQKAVAGTMDYCSSLSCRYSSWTYLFHAINTDKTVYMNSISLLQIVCSLLDVNPTQLHSYCWLNIRRLFLQRLLISAIVWKSQTISN